MRSVLLPLPVWLLRRLRGQPLTGLPLVASARSRRRRRRAGLLSGGSCSVILSIMEHLLPMSRGGTGFQAWSFARAPYTDSLKGVCTPVFPPERGVFSCGLGAEGKPLPCRGAHGARPPAGHAENTAKRRFHRRIWMGRGGWRKKGIFGWKQRAWWYAIPGWNGQGGRVGRAPPSRRSG